MLAQRTAPDGAGGTDTTTLHTAEFDALGRRIEEVVSNSGDLDSTYRYWYNGQQMIEMRDGSDNVQTEPRPSGSAPRKRQCRIDAATDDREVRLLTRAAPNRTATVRKRFRCATQYT